MGNLSDGVDVGDVGVGVAQGLQVDGAGVGPDGVLELHQVVGVHEGALDAERRQRVGQQVVGAAVDGLLGHDMAATLGQRLQRVGDGSRSRRRGQRRNAPFERRDALLQDLLGGVGETPIDVAGVGQTKARGGMLAVVEHVGRGLVDGDRARVGGRVGLLLSHVQLEGLELVRAHGVPHLSPRLNRRPCGVASPYG